MYGRAAEFGITRLANVTGLDHVGIPVWSAIRPNARTLALSQGKGITDAAAQASAIMEAIEVATAERLDLPSLSASMAELTAEGQRFDSLPSLLGKRSAPLGEAEAIAWIRGHDLIGGGDVLVPLEAVIINDSQVPVRYWQSTDGLASGNVLWEAIFHGLCERVERDALTLWSLRDDAWLAAHCIDPSAFADLQVDRLISRIEAAGLQIRLFDITSDIGIPVCFAALSPPPNGHEAHWKYFDLQSGSGCHPDWARAAIRAITEAAQSRLTTISAARDDFDPGRYQQGIKPDLLPYILAQPVLSPTAAPVRHIDRERYLPDMLDALQAVGVTSVIVVPLEDGSDGYAVAKVIVTALENPSGEHRYRFGKRAAKLLLGGK